MEEVGSEKTTSDTSQDPATDAAMDSMSSRRGVVAAAAAFAAFAGLRPTEAKATANVTVNTASTANYGILATHGATGSPVLPNIGSTTHPIIGSASSLATATLDSGVFGARSGSGRTGVLGVNAGAGFGVAGYSLDGIAIYGETNNTTAISGKSTSAVAILGSSVTQTGVQGNSDSGIALRGVSKTNYGIRGDSQTQAGVIAGTTAPGVAAIIGRSNAPSNPTAGRFVGNVRVEGNFAVTGAKAAAVAMPDGSLATMYCQEAPEPFFEDFGRGRLTNGAARIAIDSEFAGLVKLDGLMIFLTPEGDSRGLYVHAKGPEGFEVREAQGGTSTLDFSWRLVAKRGDIPGERLARLDPLEEMLLSELDDFDHATELAAAMTRDPTRREA